MDSEFSRKKALVLGVLLLVFLAIPFTVYTALQQQETRTRAIEPTVTPTSLPTFTPTPTPVNSPTPTIDPDISLTPPVCQNPDQVQNVIITCPNCSQVSPTPTEQQTN